jgi:hypothetical protein
MLKPRRCVSKWVVCATMTVEHCKTRLSGTLLLSAKCIRVRGIGTPVHMRGVTVAGKSCGHTRQGSCSASAYAGSSSREPVKRKLADVFRESRRVAPHSKGMPNNVDAIILASVDRSAAAGSLDKLATVASLSTVVILTSSTAELAPETFPQGTTSRSGIRSGMGLVGRPPEPDSCALSCNCAPHGWMPVTDWWKLCSSSAITKASSAS